MSVPKVQIADEIVSESNVKVLIDVGGKGAPLREVALGRVPPDPAALARVPKFDEFVVEGVPPPSSWTWLTAAAKVSIKQMYGNDQWGDCVIASVAHGVGVSSANESGTAIVGTTAEIVSEYHRICGAGDNGCNIAEVKNEMVRAGISVGGKKRKIDGYAAIPPGNKLAVQTAILISGGGVNIGFNVPSAWMGSNTYDGAVWDVPGRLSFVGGHDVRAVSYDERGVQFSTWGIVVTMTWAALADARIVDEMYVELEQDWNTDGTAPSNLKTDELKAALESFKAGQIPDWQPVSPPPPTPPVPPSPPVPPVPPTPPALSYAITGMMPVADRWGTVSMVPVTFTAKPLSGQADVDAVDAMLSFHGHTAGRYSLTPAQWAAIIQMILQLLPIIFPPKAGESRGVMDRARDLTPAQWAAIIQLILQLLPIFIH